MFGIYIYTLVDIHVNDGNNWWEIRQKLHSFNQIFLPSQNLNSSVKIQSFWHVHMYHAQMSKLPKNQHKQSVDLQLMFI